MTLNPLALGAILCNYILHSSRGLGCDFPSAAALDRSRFNGVTPQMRETLAMNVLQDASVDLNFDVRQRPRDTSLRLTARDIHLFVAVLEAQ